MRRRGVVVCVGVLLSGCAALPSEVSDTRDGGLPDTCSSEGDDFLLVIRPSGTVSEETWTEIRRVAEQRAAVTANGAVMDRILNGSRAILVPFKETSGVDAAKSFKSQSTYTLQVGVDGSWTTIATESTVDRVGHPQQAPNSNQYRLPIDLSQAGLKRLRRVVTTASSKPVLRTIVNGDIAGQAPLPATLRSALQQNDVTEGRLLVPIDSKTAGHRIHLAGTRPDFPVPVTYTRHNCNDGTSP